MKETNKAILVIDMQNDFVLPGAPLCVSGAIETIPAITEFLNFGRKNGWTVIFVCRVHRQSGVDAETFRRHHFRDGSGICVAGSDGAELVEGIIKEPGDILVTKTRFDAFFNTDLETVLRGAGIGEVYITGTQYPNCVRSTAVGAIQRDYAVTVVTDCCSASSPEIAAHNIADMRVMGIDCLTSDEIIKSIKNGI